jgi:DNA-binding response OmpR family regulator
MTKVLIADDSIAVRKVAERLLTEAGFGVTLAANGDEAMACLAKETPDVVVSDVIMPDKSGYEVCAFVRGQKAIANTPVLLISGIVNDEVTKLAESCRADGVLKKPFQGTSLKDRVLELLAKRQKAAEPAQKGPGTVLESKAQIQSARVSDEQSEGYQRALARLKSLEEELSVERDRATRDAQRAAQLEGELARAQEVELLLAKEQEQTADLKLQLVEAGRATARMQELEAALQNQRQESAQQATTLAELQKNASRAQELEATLHAERHAAALLVEQMAAMEQVATRVSALEDSLAAEQQKSRDLAMRLSEAERVSQTLSESNSLLQAERERNGRLTKRVYEAEQAAEQATRRFEEIATKLGEIAGLASQLGNGKRRS